MNKYQPEMNQELLDLIKKNENGVMDKHCPAITYLHSLPKPPILYIQNSFAKLLQDNKQNKFGKIRSCSKYGDN